MKSGKCEGEERVQAGKCTENERIENLNAHSRDSSEAATGVSGGGSDNGRNSDSISIERDGSNRQRQMKLR